MAELLLEAFETATERGGGESLEAKIHLKRLVLLLEKHDARRGRLRLCRWRVGLGCLLESEFEFLDTVLKVSGSGSLAVARSLSSNWQRRGGHESNE